MPLAPGQFESDVPGRRCGRGHEQGRPVHFLGPAGSLVRPRALSPIEKRRQPRTIYLLSGAAGRSVHMSRAITAPVISRGILSYLITGTDLRADLSDLPTLPS